jgi:histidinol-phosphate phosphatase family domain/HAD-superfamily hydrolase, subfamily IIIA
MKINWKEIVTDDWTLFLDRDGVINDRIVGGYVASKDEFHFLPNVLDAMEVFSRRFKHVILITNQQGIGKGLMTFSDLSRIHDYMKKEIEGHSGRIDAIYACPQRVDEPDNFRKPSPEMAFMAQKRFPDINLSHSIMVGDSASDMLFGKNAGCMTVFIGDRNSMADASYNSLFEFSKTL